MNTAVITGGAGGMGLATARILARDHHVVLGDVDEDRVTRAASELRREGLDVQAAECDITDRDSVDLLFGRAAAAGTVRAVVHAAGVSPQMGDAGSIVLINALGTINVTEAALVTAGEGFAIVNVASVAGHMAPRFLIPRRAYRFAVTDPTELVTRLTRAADRVPEGRRPGMAYSISKHFVIWYSQHMAAAFGERGARIVSVSPGTFDTEMGRLEELSGSHRLLEYAALKRYGRPEEVAELLAFCASTRPGYLTGTDILCDGGTRAGLGLRGKLALARSR